MHAASPTRAPDCGRQLGPRGASGPAGPRVAWPAPSRRRVAALASYFATCHPGLESVVAAELAGPHIAAAGVAEGRAGVAFSGDAGVGYRANLWLRAATRVLLLLAERPLDPEAPPGEEVYRAFRGIADWAELLAPGQSFGVDARVWDCTSLSNSQLLAVRAKDAVCDAVRDRRGDKPDPPRPGRPADLPLFATAYRDRLAVYRDMGGASLHRRGYRQAMHRASLNEAAAAGMLYLAGWGDACRGGGVGAALADPMCGSGTFLIEAALMATDTAPGLFRRFWPCRQWPDYDAAAWEAAEGAAVAARRETDAQLWGNDRHAGALGLAARDADAAGVRDCLRLHHGEAATWRLPHAPALVLTNPPWGQRLMGGGGADDGGDDGDWRWEEEERRGARPGGDAEELAAAWKDLGAFLKGECGGSAAWVLSGNPDATRHMRLRADNRVPVTVGGVDCRLLQYSIRGRVDRA